MKDQTGQEIVVGQTVAVSVEAGLRIGEVIVANPDSIQLKVDSVSRPGKLAKIWYSRPWRTRIIAQPFTTKDIEKAVKDLETNNVPPGPDGHYLIVPSGKHAT